MIFLNEEVLYLVPFVSFVVQWVGKYVNKEKDFLNHQVHQEKMILDDFFE